VPALVCGSSLERDVLDIVALVGRVVGDRLGGAFGGASLRAVLEGDVVELERDPAIAGVGDVLARIEASGEVNRLALA
jgi:hypothetical protein